MTIALGILGKDTVVIAADTQETYSGVLKVNQGKILGVLNGPEGKPSRMLVLTGAGSAVHLDALQQTICDAFSRTDPRTLHAVEELFRPALIEFHAQHVAPFASWPEYDRPACSLVMGTMVNGRTALAVTEKTAVRFAPYGAVGIGAAHASLLLGRLWRPGCSCQAAVSLAAYVMFNVKHSVEGCGKDTQIVVLQKNKGMVYEVERIEQMEREFKNYAEAEDRALRYVLGFGPTKPASTTLSSSERGIPAEAVEHVE